MIPTNDSIHDHSWSQKGLRTLLSLAALIIVLAGMRAAAGFLVPVAFAIILSILSYPIMGWLMRHKVPFIVALALTVLTNVGIVAGLVIAAISLWGRVQGDLPQYIDALQTQVDSVAAWLELQGVAGARHAVEDVFDWKKIMGYAAQEDVMHYVGSALGTTFGTVASVFVGAVIVFVLMIFTLLEARGTQSRVVAVKLAGGPDLTHLIQSFGDIQKYLGIKTFISALTGILAGCACLAFGLKYPLLWAIMAFVFHFIPAVGSTAAGIPAVIEALVRDGWGSALTLAILYVLINFTCDYFVQPALLGRRFGISSLVIVLSVIFWGWLWGPIGMFLAVPLTMVCKVLMDTSEEFRWISVAMSKKKIVGNEVRLDAYEMDLSEPEGLPEGVRAEAPSKNS
ncbi:MAG: putative PurR-regulated permease PerM [Verrucomicrobiaceae bacterium]|nr:putative PurR-regulated permease PerM [Verrucomicrobiaceae bacterium]